MTAAVVRSESSVPESVWLQRMPRLCMGAAVAVSVPVVGLATRSGAVAGLLAVLAVAAGLEILRRPVLGALIVVAAVPVTAGLRRGLPVPFVRPSELLVLTVVPIVLVAVGGRASARWRALDWALLTYVVATALLGAYNVARHGAAFDGTTIGKILSPVQFLLLLRVASVTSVTPAIRRTAARLLLLASLPVAGIAVLQQANIGGTRRWLARVLDTDIFSSFGYRGFSRATSVFPHWNTLAGYEFLIVLLCVGLALAPGQRVLSRRQLVVVLAANAAALLLSATIAAAFGVVVGGFVLGVWHGRTRAVVAGFVAAATLAVLLFGSFLAGRVDQQYDRTYSVDQNPLVPHSLAMRIDVWKHDYIPAVEGRLATGYGPDIPPEVRWGFTESLYITLLLRGGLPLLCAFFLLTLAWVAALRRYADDDDVDRRTLARVATVAVLVLLPMQLVFPYLTNAGLSHLIWVLTGVVVAGAAPGDEVDEDAGDSLAGVSVPERRARRLAGVP